MALPVDTGFAQWLRGPALYVNWPNAGLAAGLLGSAIEQEIISPYATKAGAEAAAPLQIDFLGGPLAFDRHIVKGTRRDLIGKAVTFRHALLGYSGAGAVGFVVEADELEGGGTALLVARKLV